jgi:hypothetical protein
VHHYAPAPGGAGPRPRTASDPVSAGAYGREWRSASTKLTRALGRPIRDQVTSIRATQATTLQALELVNGELLTQMLMRGARRMLGELPRDPESLYNAAVGGRYAAARAFDIDVARASKLWLIVTDTGSNAPERVQPMWAQAEFVTADGSAVPLSSLTPVDASGLRGGSPSSNSVAARVSVTNPSRLVYDISGKGFTRFRGSADIENPRSEVGSTLNPALRFFVFDAEPNLDRMVPPAPAPPLPAAPAVTTPAEVVERIFWHALNRAPTAAERRDAEAAVLDPHRPGRASVEGVADLLWAVLVKPEFLLIY